MLFAGPAGSGHNYEFHVNGNVINNGSVDSLNFYPKVHGTFKDYVVIRNNDVNICNDTLYVSGSIKVKGPVAAFTVPAQICADSGVVIKNNSFSFFATDSITKWLWDFGDNQKDSVKNPIPHIYKTADTHNIKLIAVDINGCAQTITQSVIINPLPRLSIIPAVDTLCINDTAILKAYTVDTLLWTPDTNISCISCSTVSVYPNATTNYIARAMNEFGCKSYDTSLIKTYAPFKLIVSPTDTSVCPGLPVQLNMNVIGKTLWSPSTFLNDPSIPNPVSTPGSSIKYNVVVQDSVGCFTDSAAININVYSKATVDAGPDTTLPVNTSFTLNPVYSGNVINYLWTPAATLSCTDCASTSGIALQKQTYQIQITDINGCKTSDSVTVFVICEKSNLLLPNAFTPNNDGLNDNFYPFAKGYNVIKSFMIFDRWGNKVFERKNFQPNIPSLGWNGRIKGDPNISTQSFVWMVEGECDSGEIINTRGTAMLIR